MRNSLLRPLLVVEFLLAIQVVFTVWSQVGGQYHLDLMFWPWKLAFGVGAAWLIVAMTAALARNGGELKGPVLLLASLLLTLMLAAGAVTYYYHLNEPPSEDDQEEDGPAITSSLTGSVPDMAPGNYYGAWRITIPSCGRIVESMTGGPCFRSFLAQCSKCRAKCQPERRFVVHDQDPTVQRSHAVPLSPHKQTASEVWRNGGPPSHFIGGVFFGLPATSIALVP